MIIHIGNKYKPETHIGKVIYCARGSIWGNPFPITATDDRDSVCDKYDVYFDNRLATDDEFKTQFKALVNEVKEYEEVTLLCFCFPKRCHCLKIKREIKKGVI